MSIDTLDLFTKIGAIGGIALGQAQFRSGALGSSVNALVGLYTDLTSQGIVAPVTNQLPTSQSLAEDLIVNALVTCAQATLVAAVQDDQPAQAWTVTSALAELVRQMGLLGQTVARCGTTISVTALPVFTGTGLLVTSTQGSGSDAIAGLTLENLYPETLWLTCSADAQTGGATAGQEQFLFQGGQSQPDVWSDLWPQGSGGTLNLNACDPAVDAASNGNQLTNGGFDSFAANTPENWVIETGTAGTQILAGGSGNAYTGTNCLALAGGTTLAALSETFGQSSNAATGTAGILLPNALYAVAVRLAATATPSTGSLVLEVLTAANAAVTDPQGNPLSVTIPLTALTTSYSAVTAVWVTPRALPAAYKFRLRVGAAIQTGVTVYVDSLIVCPMTAAYNGGPSVAVIAGSVPFAANDGWQITTANDYNLADFAYTFQALFNRLFDMTDNFLQLPSTDGTPTYSDSLITA